MSNQHFNFSQTQLKTIANDIVKQANDLGIEQIQLELVEAYHKNIDILEQNIENIETSKELQLNLLIYNNKKKAMISISGLELSNIKQMLQQAIEITKYSQTDAAHGLIAAKYLALNDAKQELNIFHPQVNDTEDIINQLMELEQLALDQPFVTQSEGASFSFSMINFVLANSYDFCLGYQSSRFSKSLSLIGKNKDELQTDYWGDSKRAQKLLDSNTEIAQQASDRLVRRLNRSTIKSGCYDVIFESLVAQSIIGSLVAALNGNNIYKKTSFLTDKLEQLIMPEWLNINDDPFIPYGLGSCYFDNEGAQVQSRIIINNGVIKNYLLNSYTARKLNMEPTGNSGGAHNLCLNNNHQGGAAQLISQMDYGVMIIETIGHGLNIVTGDYSLGASGILIQDGQAQGFVDNMTLSGNLLDLYRNIKYISDDRLSSSVLGGSILSSGINISA